MFTKNVTYAEVAYEPTSPVPQKYSKVFQVDGKTIELNIWDTSGGKEVEVTSLRQNKYPSMVS